MKYNENQNEKVAVFLYKHYRSDTPMSSMRFAVVHETGYRVAENDVDFCSSFPFLAITGKI